MSVSERQINSGAHSGGIVFTDNLTARDLLRLSKYGVSFDHRAKSIFEDDFHGDTLDTKYSGAKGADAQAVVPTINSQVNGVVRLTSGDVGDTFANDGSSLTHELNWKANQNNLFIEGRIKPVSSVANVAFFFGFSDSLATGTLEAPFTLSGTTFTSNATDAVGILFDTAATTDTIRCVGVKADTDATPIDTSIAPVADTSYWVEIYVDSSGNATFLIDGVNYGTIANAVTASVALTPILTIVTRTTASKSIDLDYWRYGADRA